MPQLFPKRSTINSGLSFPHEVSYLYKSCKKIICCTAGVLLPNLVENSQRAQKLLMNKNVTKRTLFPLETTKPFSRMNQNEPRSV